MEPELSNLNCLLFLVRAFHRQANPCRTGAVALCLCLGLSHPVDAEPSANRIQAQWQASRLEAWETLKSGDALGAERLYRIALSQARMFGPEDLRIAESLRDLAELYRARGDITNAMQYYQQCISMREKVLGPQHQSLYPLLKGVISLHQGDRTAEVDKWYQRLMTIQEIIYKPEDPELQQTLLDWATLAMQQRRYQKAQELARRLLAIRQHMPSQELGVVKCLSLIGHAYIRQGNRAQAEKFLAKAEQLLLKAPDQLSWKYRDAVWDLASILKTYDYLAQARDLYQHLLTVQEKMSFDDQHTKDNYISATLLDIADLSYRLKDDTWAERNCKRALALLAKHKENETAYYMMGVEILARLAARKHDYLRAEKLEREALSLRKRLSSVRARER